MTGASLRILVVTKYYHPMIGGVETLVKTLSERYVVLGHQCTVLCMDPYRDGDEVINGVRVVRFHRRGLSRSGLDPGIWRWMSKNDISKNFDIVNIHNFHAPLALQTAFFCHTRNVPFVFTTHYHGCGQTPSRNLLFRFYRIPGKKIFDWCEVAICVSTFEMNLVKRDFVVPESRLTLIPNGGKDYPNIDTVRRKDLILYVGRLVEYKGIDHIIKALGMLKNEDVDFRLRIVGSGPDRERLRALAEGLNISDRVEWLEDISENLLNEEYRSATVLVLLSSKEAYGLVVAEALACGTPCIVARTSALTEFTIEPGCFGVDYPPNDREVADLIKMIKSGNVKVGPFSEKIISWKQVTDRYLGAYEMVVADRRATLSKKHSD
jgi:glycosyltransferase involved in cell wall biosynthesis